MNHHPMPLRFFDWAMPELMTVSANDPAPYPPCGGDPGDPVTVPPDLRCSGRILVGHDVPQPRSLGAWLRSSRGLCDRSGV